MLVLLHFTFVARVSGHPMQGRHLSLGLNRPFAGLIWHEGNRLWQKLWGVTSMILNRNTLPYIPAAQLNRHWVYLVQLDLS